MSLHYETIIPLVILVVQYIAILQPSSLGMSYFADFSDISKKFLTMNTTGSRKRRYTTKNKTGCITCRIRRVKCDEDKPSCHRCVSTGRKCDGYDITPLVSSGRILRPIVSGGSDPESQAIYQFRTRIATLIASSFDANFWTYDVLHTSDRYTPVRHALAALASAYQKSILLGIESKSCDMFIFSQYQKAMKALSICFQEPKVLSISAKLAALVTNFLFTYLCSLQGLRQEALLHLRNGLALIHEWGDLRGQGQHVMTDILGLYMRLDTQTRVISTTDSTSHCLGGRSQRGTLQGTSGTPSVCSLLRQLDAIHGQILQPSNIQASILSTEYSLRVWDRRFENLSVTSQEERKHMTALRMRRIMVEVTLHMATSRSSDAQWTVDKNCKTILDLAIQLIQDFGLRPAQAGFYLANGLVEALYFVAVTSEDWDLRYQAIQVLRQYRFTDGVWGSNAAADLAEGRLQGDIYQYRQQLEA